MIGIMAAMHDELKRIVILLENVSEEIVGHKTVYLGTLNQQSVIVVFSGWGKVASASTATMLVERYQITKLIFTGVAGAIAPYLEIGDIVIGESFVQHDMDCAEMLGIQKYEIPLLSLIKIKASVEESKLANNAAEKFLNNDLKMTVDFKELIDLGVKEPKVYRGLIATGDQFIHLEQQHSALTSAFPDLLAVEMEGGAVAQVAYGYSLPFSVIRVISDKADQDSKIDFPRFTKQVASHFTAGIINRLI